MWRHLGHQDLHILGLQLLLVDHQVEAEYEGEDPLVLLVERTAHLNKQYLLNQEAKIRLAVKLKPIQLLSICPFCGRVYFVLIELVILDPPVWNSWKWGGRWGSGASCSTSLTCSSSQCCSRHNHEKQNWVILSWFKSIMIAKQQRPVQVKCGEPLKWVDIHGAETTHLLHLGSRIKSTAN